MTLPSITGKAPRVAASPLVELTAAEFFAGIGLVRLALEQAGWRIVFANDYDVQKAAMYRANFDAEHLVAGDIRDVTADAIPACELFTASFPCNDLSVAGARAGLNGTQSGAFWEFERLLREKGDRRPALVLLENVVGFLSSHGGRDLEAALAALGNLGYRVDLFVLNAAHFVPQSRVRLFVVGKRLPVENGATAEVSVTRPPAVVEFIESHPDLPWDLRRLPDPPPRSHRLEEILEDLPADDPLWWSAERAAYFMNQLSERHLAVAQAMIAGDELTYGTAFRRIRKGRSMAELRTDGIAGCLRTPRGGSGRQILFQAGRGAYAVRLLSARECARLQGAPDSYQIDVRLNQALFGFGDAVCVPAIRWIADHYLTPVVTDNYQRTWQ